jgi:dihydrofolate reductase
VLSNTLESAHWPKTRFLRGLDQIAALKQQAGKDIYLMGGGRITANLIEGGLVDELRLIVSPLIAGGGEALFPATGRRHGLQLRKTQPLRDGLVSLIYEIHDRAKNRNASRSMQGVSLRLNLAIR